MAIIRTTHLLKTLPFKPSHLSLQRITTTRTTFPISRHHLYSTATATAPEPPDYLDANERKVFTMIQQSLSPTALTVQDISGGCGSMYGIEIVSEKFRGLSVMKQHRLVNSVLGEEIKKWHGVQLKTKVPEEGAAAAA